MPVVPIIIRPASAMANHRHLPGSKGLQRRDGGSLTQKVVRSLALIAARRAQLGIRGVHVLRHTFYPHLATRGAPARAIQEPAAHKIL